MVHARSPGCSIPGAARLGAVHVCECAHMCVYARTCVLMHMCVYVHMCVSMHIRVCRCTRVYMYIRVCRCTCVCPQALQAACRTPVLLWGAAMGRSVAAAASLPPAAACTPAAARKQ